MLKKVQNENFIRYIYCLKYSCSNFDEYILNNRVTIYGILKTESIDMPIRVQIEPYKNINSNTSGAIHYLRNCFPHDPIDVTGLFPTMKNNIYYGDYKKNVGAKVLILFQFILETKELIIDVFDNFYPINKTQLQELINGHYWHKKSTPKECLKVVQNFKGHKK